MTTPATPTLNPRVIALAHYAGRALLENVLARHGATFQQSVTLRLVAVAEGPVDREQLVGQVVDALKIDEADVHAVVEELVEGGMLTTESTLLSITDTGRELYRTTSAETAPISARIYAGIPAGDLAVAGRVLSLINERANTELAAMAGPAAE
ncbi:MarR family winged helix-turn-helix transcriptional regulator [Streptomyces sp. ADMS]|uniref:MarR family winged helix-turn-helix transcriptional regulator n=1 Tax=Streptomyces sp. ADMS TaxID=3071415 RepID=UPI00296F3B3F|nr:MarR family winged helix-turn-helix transcriptional regulator [Streptomyces sp. ADMS]MDW4908933.1 MarR family winged helix-turn-helix transcriptional regulator [Streptomyces sp. ADMS]